MNKRLLNFICLAFTLFFLVAFGTTAKAENVKGISIESELGFKNKYKVGTDAPLKLKIKDDYKDIQGLIEVRVPDKDTMYISFAKNLSIQKGSEKEINIDVPIKDGTMNYKVVIYDGKEEIYSKEISVGRVSNNITQFIGILSDDFDSLTYINKIPAQQGMTVLTEVIKLDEKNFPVSKDVMKAFNLIIINNYDSSKLSEEQYDNLKQWISNGGTLLIGTGTNSKKTLGLFKDDFLQGKIGELGKVKTSKVYELGTNGDSKNVTELEIQNIEVKDSTTEISEGNMKLLQKVVKGKGVIGVLGFDLGLAPFVGWSNNSTFAEKIIAITNPSVSLTNMDEKMMFQDTGMVRSIIDMFSQMAAPKITPFFIILLVYIFIVAPLSYLILKKLDKREFMWITVPIIALIFGGIVYAAGSGTRLNKVTTNVFNLVKLNSSGVASEQSYAGIYTPKKMKVVVDGKEKQGLSLLVEPYYQGADPKSKNINQMSTRIYQDRDSIEFYDQNIFETKILRLEPKNVEIGNLVADIRVKDGHLQGTLKNSTNLNLKECYIITPSEYYNLGEIKAGATITLSKNTDTYNGNIDQLLYEKIFSMNGAMNAQVSREKQQKIQMVRMALFNGYGYNKLKRITFFAFSDTNLNKPLTINGEDAKKNEQSIVSSTIDINTIDGDKVEYPLGYVQYVVGANNGLQYNDYEQTFYGNGSAEITYTFDSRVKIENVEIDTEEASRRDSSRVLLLIYNLKNDKYEPIKNNKISGEDISVYVNGENKLKLKIQLNGDSLPAPLIGAKGRIK